MIKESNLHIRKIRHSKLENNVMLTFEATGSPPKHQKLIDKLLEDDEAKSFIWEILMPEEKECMKGNVNARRIKANEGELSNTQEG